MTMREILELPGVLGASRAEANPGLVYVACAAWMPAWVEESIGWQNRGSGILFEFVYRSRTEADWIDRLEADANGVLDGPEDQPWTF